MLKRVFLLIPTLTMSFSILMRCKIMMRLTPATAASFLNPPRFSRILQNMDMNMGKSMKQIMHQSSSLVLYSDREEMSTSASSWIDKNNNFSRFESHHPSGSSTQAPGKKAEKQRRRRNNKRREEYNESIIDREQQNFRENFRGTRVFVQGLPDWVNWQEVSFFFFLRDISFSFSCLEHQDFQIVFQINPD